MRFSDVILEACSDFCEILPLCTTGAMVELTQKKALAKALLHYILFVLV